MHTYPDGVVSSYPDTLDQDDDSRVTGEIPPTLPTRPSLLDQLAGQAHMNGLAREFVDQYVVCWCEDGTHPVHEFHQRKVWHDGDYAYLTAWHDRYDAAQVDQTCAAGTSHIVHRRELRISNVQEVQP